jgi:hypothetical protein
MTLKTDLEEAIAGITAAIDKNRMLSERYAEQAKSYKETADLHADMARELEAKKAFTQQHLDAEVARLAAGEQQP